MTVPVTTNLTNTDLHVFFTMLHLGATIPSYAKYGDACLDFTATSKVYDEYGNTVYGTGIAMAIPEGYVGLLFPRSSISTKLQTLANSVGVIDSGYRGEIIFKFKPLEPGHAKTDENDQYEVGDRVGQMLILPYPKVQLMVTSKLPESQRGTGGFGSSGR